MAMRQLACACCGGDAGRWQQWWNQDTGYGVCAKCVKWMRGRGETDENIRSYYGVEGINWGGESTEQLREVLGQALSQ